MRDRRPAQLAITSPTHYEATSAGWRLGARVVAARLLARLDANGGHSRRSPSRPHGEWPTSRMRQNPPATVARIIRNFAGRKSDSEDCQIRIFLVRGFRRSYRGLSRPNHHDIAHPDPRQMNVPKLKVRKDRMASEERRVG